MADNNLQVSIVMPCLNEEKTVGWCVQKARHALSKLGVEGEVIVADNGSIDSSVRQAKENGARVILVASRGYGSALLAGIKAVKGEWVVMGDSDGTYDFSQINRLIAPLESGYDLVVGSRLTGKIKKGAMPVLNRFFGTPTLNLFLRFFYHLKLTDSQSGMRAFTKKAFARLKLKTLGMEFASEMLVRASQVGLRITEVPITYSQRIAPSKLSRFRDAWRHLRFMMIFAPSYLFILPGLLLSVIGGVSLLLLSSGPVWFLGRAWDVHTQIMASMLTLLGSQVLMMGFFAKAFSWTQGFEKETLMLASVLRYFQLEKGLLLGFFLFLGGLVIGLVNFFRWANQSFGVLWAIRPLILAMTLVVLGIQIIFSSFFLSILGIERK